MKRRGKGRTTGYLLNAVTVVLLAVFIFPIFWMILASFKTQADIFARPPKFIFQPVLSNYATSLSSGAGASFLTNMLNSAIIGVASTVIAVGMGTLAGYSFSRFNFRGKSDMLFYILSQRMLPPVVIVVPIFIMYKFLGLLDSHLGLIILYTVFNLSFAVWIMKSFIDEIPVDYEDAARIDGYSRFQAFRKVVLPQLVPGMIATGFFCLIVAWNEFVFSLILTSSVARTAPPYIAFQRSVFGILWGEIAASSVMFMLPIIIFTFLLRNHLLRGMTFGAIKR
ncbi:MAG: carbohydrate ABC transporter permease [Chloroflexi bacterium]|nr:carbohydrate ABC transporter permease [Chloroflexota bacterium]